MFKQDNCMSVTKVGITTHIPNLCEIFSGILEYWTLTLQQRNTKQPPLSTWMQILNDMDTHLFCHALIPITLVVLDVKCFCLGHSYYTW